MNKCANCGALFEPDEERHMYCRDCLPERYNLQGPLTRAEQYPDDDESLGIDEEEREVR